MGLAYTKRSAISKSQIETRRRYLGATMVTCIVLTFIGGVVHVLQLGANRMHEMRGKVAYDISDEKNRLRSAGEELFLQTQHEFRVNEVKSYTVEEADALLTQTQWQELETMVVIPAGEFIMGTDYGRADAQDRPQRTETIAKSFKIDKYPVTNAEYARFVAATGHRPPLHWENGRIPDGLERHPVTMVSWFDAKAYSEWAGKRLATEIEWEMAARGNDGRRWPWGNSMDPQYLNTYYQYGSTTEVGSFADGASPYGVMDMAGNVSEWVFDDFLPYTDSAAPEDLFKAKVPQIPVSASERSLKVVDFVSTDERYKVMRGGSWKSDPFSTSSYHRNFSWPQFASDFFGFRCVQDIAS